MCDEFISFELNKQTPCKCKMAVMNVYGRLMGTDIPPSVAMEAAYNVYRYHHPEQPKSDARLIVERWVASDHLH